MMSLYEEDRPQAWGADLRPGHPIDGVRLVWALRRRWRRIALAFLLGIPLGALIAWTLAPREYTAQAVLIWEPSPERVIAYPEQELETLVDTIKLPGNLAKVRKRLGLPLRLDALGRRIDAGVARNSNLLRLQGRGDTAEEARRLTEAITQVFLDSRAAVERARAEDRLQALGEEIERVQAQLTQARERYERFNAENGVTDLALERQAAIEEAALLRAEVDRHRIQVESEEAKAALLRSATGREPRTIILAQTQIQAEARKLAELRAELTARGAHLSSEHPEIQGLAASVETLERKPSDSYAPTDRSVGTNPHWMFLQNGLAEADVEREAAWHKWQSYTRLESSARERLTRLSAVEGLASLMLTEIRLAENRLGELKAEQKIVDGRARQPAIGFRVLSSADLPSYPTRSYRRPVALAFPLLLGLMAVVACAVEALRGLALWTPSEIAFWGRAPVVAASAWPARAEALEDLLLDLGAPLARARGATLLVALAPEQSERAVELASRLEQELAVSLRDVPTRDGGLVLWREPERSQALRRKARQSDRVLVLVQSGAHSLFEITAIRRLLGREERMGFIVLGLGTGFARLPDQVGDVEGFWRAHADPPRPEHPSPRPQENGS
jgi:uncharacterized protein involved in exopolysaccharide biosynthesis